MTRKILGAVFAAFLLAALTAGCTTTGYTGGTGGRGGGWENFRAATPQPLKDAWTGPDGDSWLRWPSRWA